MLTAVWLATAIGLVAGAVLAYRIGSVVLPRAIARSADRLLAARLALAGTVIALLPALLLSFVVGGTLGGAFGEYLFGLLGLRLSGVPAGVALGIALVFALVLLAGAAAGILTVRVLFHQRHRRAGRSG